MEIHTFYIVRWRKIFMGIILIFTSFIPYLSLYIALLKEESFFSIIASFGVANIPFIILMIIRKVYRRNTFLPPILPKYIRDKL